MKLAAWATPNPDAVHSLTLTGFPPSPATRIADLQLHHRAILFDLAQNEVRFIVSGHTKAVEALALSASGDSIGIIKLWDAATGNALLSMEAHRGGVESLAFHPSGLQMASTGADETVRIWWGE